MAPDSARPRPGITVAAATAAVTVAFVTAAGFAIKGAGLVEMPLSRAFNKHHHGLIGTVGDALYRGIGPVPAIIGTVIVTMLILILTRSLPRASTFAFTVAVTWLSVAVCKLLVHRPRPDAALLPFPFHPAQIDASYPSGHAAFVTALAITAFLMTRSLPSRIITAILGTAAVLVAGILLAVDGVHYPTDVAASIIWVVGVAPAVYLVWTRYVLPKVEPRLPVLRGTDYGKSRKVRVR